MKYTVKQLAQLAGVTVRTLHYYDEIGLLSATTYGENGYRYYGEEAVLRLQQILFYRELDLSLNEIAAILDGPDFDVLEALQTHREALQQKASRISSLIRTIDKTVAHLKGEREMSTKQLFEGFDEATQQRYEQEATQRYGEKNVKESVRRWNRYSPQEKAQIGAEGEAIYRDFLTCIHDDPASAEVQEIVGRWHQHLRYFYEPSPEVLAALGQRYNEDPAFMATFEKIHPELPQFLRQAIEHYCEEMLLRV